MHKNKKIITQIITIAILIFVSFHALPTCAQVTPDDQQRALNKLQKIQQKQENLIQYLGREYEQNEREKAKPQIEVQKHEEQEVTGGACFHIKTIEIKNAESLSDEEKDRLTAIYLSNCMDIALINQLMHKISTYYFDKGYVTTRVVIPQQNLKEGILELRVVEGKIESIELNEKTWRDNLQVKTSFPFLVGKVLNLRDIEQGLDQLNRLSSSKATMQFVPGSKDGYTKIIITNPTEKQNRASVGYNNSGQGSTGKNKGTLLLERDSLFGLGEYLNFSYNKDTAVDAEERGNKVLSGLISVPFGYYTLSGSALHSEYRTTIRGTNQSFRSSGKTQSGTLTLKRVLHRDQNSKTSVALGFTHKNTIAFIEDSETATGTRALSISKFELDHTYKVWDSVLYGSLGYERGLNAFGAREDVGSLTFKNPRAQFDKFTIDFSIYKPFAIRQQNFAYRMLASGQYSPDPLFSSEQINIGDRYTVRGFQAESLAGDSGGYIRNEIMWNAQQFTTNKYVNNLVGGLQLYVGLDGGWTRIRGGKSNSNPNGEGHITGWAVGLRNTSQWINFDVAYSKQINSPRSFTGNDDEVYFSLGTNLGF